MKKLEWPLIDTVLLRKRAIVQMLIDQPQQLEAMLAPLQAEHDDWSAGVDWLYQRGTPLA